MISEPGPLDASAWLQYFAFDIQGQLNFSESLGFLETGTDVDSMISLADKMIEYISYVRTSSISFSLFIFSLKTLD